MTGSRQCPRNGTARELWPSPGCARVPAGAEAASGRPGDRAGRERRRDRGAPRARTNTGGGAPRCGVAPTDREVAGAEYPAQLVANEVNDRLEVERRRHALLDAGDDGELAPALLELGVALVELARQGLAHGVAVERRGGGVGERREQFALGAAEAAAGTVDVGIEIAAGGGAGDERRDDARALMRRRDARRAVTQARVTRPPGLVEPGRDCRPQGPGFSPRGSCAAATSGPSHPRATAARASRSSPRRRVRRACRRGRRAWTAARGDARLRRAAPSACCSDPAWNARPAPTSARPPSIEGARAVYRRTAHARHPFEASYRNVPDVPAVAPKPLYRSAQRSAVRIFTAAARCGAHGSGPLPTIEPHRLENTPMPWRNGPHPRAPGWQANASAFPRAIAARLKSAGCLAEIPAATRVERGHSRR